MTRTSFGYLRTMSMRNDINGGNQYHETWCIVSEYGGRKPKWKWGGSQFLYEYIHDKQLHILMVVILVLEELFEGLEVIDSIRLYR